MIISHRHRFVFIAIPKTGTHSVRQALRQHLGPEDQEQVGLFQESVLPYPELAAMRHGHITLTQLRPHLGEEAFASYFKFAFVRNPFDRFVSFASFMTRNNGTFDHDPRRVMRYLIMNPPYERILFAQQHTFVADPNGVVIADEVGRVEDMQASYDRFAARLGIPGQRLDKANSSRRGDYRAYYDQPLIDGVANLYRRDLDLFGYTF